MGREPVTDEIGGRKVTSQPLPFPKAQALLPEVAELIGLIAREAGDLIGQGKIDIKKEDIAKLIPVLASVAAFFGQGRLERLAPRIMAATTVVMPDEGGEMSNYELGKEKDRDYVFDEQPELYFQILFFAGKVTFARFFPVSALVGKGTRKPSS